jgi:uncharacterized 2Fe-2S/4Fe-4S cluster protein (DUF4445 family)
MAEPAPAEHTLILLPSGRRGRVPHGVSLLDAARSLGVELESICGGRQTCGKCQAVVEEGHFAKHGLTSRAEHLTPVEARERECCREHGIQVRRLACAAGVVGDLVISVPPESQAVKQIIAKAATKRVIEVRPAVRQVYVEVPGPQLGSKGGDWERLSEALRKQWQLQDLSVDPTVLPGLQTSLRETKGALTVTLWQDSRVLQVEPGYAEGAYGLAVDVGTTSLAAHLCDLRTGAVLATEAAVNPQVRYGEDVMSRVSYGMSQPQGVERMHRAVVRAINDLAAAASAAAGISAQEVHEVVLVGNPVMHHLLLGIDPVELGRAPFALAISGSLDLPAVDLGLALHPAGRAHVLPCIAGHVGADHVAVLLAEAPHLQDEMMLVIDVGTNAEIALGNRRRLLCASSPTGPAFEGAQITHGQRAAPGAIERVRIDPHSLEPRLKLVGYPEWLEPAGDRPAGLAGEQFAEPARDRPADPARGHTSGPGSAETATDQTPSPSGRPTGICGSGIIEALAEMFLAGIIDGSGRFTEQGAARSPRVRFRGRAGEYVLADGQHTSTGLPIVVTQMDVRAIQLAKAALYTGAKLLMQALGVERVDRIVLAGAFGSTISPEHAMLLGMIPDCALERVSAVGNAAGDGARIALLNREQRVEAERLAGWVEHVQTANHPDFQEQFVAAISIPHASDPFPNLEPRLAGRRQPPQPRRSRRRGVPHHDRA